jgi:demethylmenaquinone methyltransferase/2-methoxy-6-polyprenyl-1,4-benzoquinol methylase
MSRQGIDRHQWENVIDVLEDILPYYEKLNILNTFGRLGKWRRAAAGLSSKDDVVLEIGPGSGGFARMLDCDRLFCLDPSKGILEYTNQQLNGKEVGLVGGIAENLPFADGTFDIVFCIFSFRDFMSRENGLREINRVLKKGGRICVVDVSMPQDGLLKGLVNLHIYKVAPRLSALAFPKERRRAWINQGYPSLLETLESFGGANQYPHMCTKAGFSAVKLKFLSARSAFMMTGVK